MNYAPLSRVAGILFASTSAVRRRGAALSRDNAGRTPRRAASRTNPRDPRKNPHDRHT